jgi:hypothetical protein
VSGRRRALKTAELRVWTPAQVLEQHLSICMFVKNTNKPGVLYS